MKNKSKIIFEKFLFPTVFKIEKGFYNKKPTSNYTDKNIPFLGATAFNNGISDFYNIDDIEKASKVGYGKNEPLEKKIYNKNCIVVTNNGSVGHAYFHKSNFTCSHDVNPLYLNNKDLNRNLGLYLITCIEKQKVCFEYARKWRPKRMVKSSLLLPISDQLPDYQYMEDYNKRLFQQKENEYLDYILKRYNEFDNILKPIPLDKKEWKTFKIIEIFQKIQRGKRLKKADHLQGNTPYASSTSLNNGIDGFVGNKTNVRIFKNCLTLANSGSVGCTFYQPFNIVASDHVTMLENNTLNKYIYLFLSSMLSRLNEKYSFNREINDTRLSKEKILLPIRLDGSPDYEYMEQYMKYQEYQKIKEYLEYKKRV